MAKYFGWTLEETRSLSSFDFEMCWQMIPTLRAEETLRMITATSYPHTKTESQKKIHRELHREMQRFEPEKEAVAIDQLAMIMQSKV